ncbi:hypothetical protein [Microbacterium sp. 4-7]|uniref:hypothetical protein n=1 Tax=Microbacterium sp. 4-7 TaxID=1885327 RepID=UPI00164F6830|nr:hypothetical protein [Microbacterium sp. 4-7]MBC6496114.1 hypothetical protein [Microbacterium sp. 4-7]
MVDDVTAKLVTAIRNLQNDVRRLLSSRGLENSSVRGGRLRFIGGILRLDSGALLDLIGQWRLKGPGAITGDVYSEGVWTQVGDWDFTGDGDLAGDVDLSGIFTLIGKLIAGDIRIEDGNIYVGAGASQIVINGAAGTITVGGMTIDPADGGKVTFPGGAQLRADVGNGIQMQIGAVKISAQASFIQLTIGTRSITINSSGIRADLPTAPIANWPGRQVGDVVSNASGDLFRIVA